MTTNMTHVKPKAGFSEALKKGLIRDLYSKHKITQNQYERLMQLQRSR